VEESSGLTTPWKISNKYYTADVHFEGMTIDRYLSKRSEFDGVPAVLFAWNRGEVRSQFLPSLLLASSPIRRFLYVLSLRRSSLTENTWRSWAGRSTRSTRRSSSPPDSRRTSLILPSTPPRRRMTIRRWKSLFHLLDSSSSMGTTIAAEKSWIRTTSPPVSHFPFRNRFPHPLPR
jgi:hypothetical protein